MALGPFAGPIYTIILIVDCIFFLFLEWWLPREDLDFVDDHWDPKVFAEVGVLFSHSNFTSDLTCFCVARNRGEEEAEGGRGGSGTRRRWIV